MESRTLTPVSLSLGQISARGLVVLAEQFNDAKAQVTEEVVKKIVKDDRRAYSPQGQSILTMIVQCADLFNQHKLVAINVVGDKNHRCIAVPQAHFQPWLEAAREEWSRVQWETAHPLQDSGGYRRPSDRFPRGTFGRLGGSNRPRGWIG